MTERPRFQPAISLAQAADAAPTLVALQERIRTSQRCLSTIRHLLPPLMQTCVKAGPVQDTEWCLLVSGAAAASKLRQLVPALLRELHQSGEQISAIRLKIQTSTR